MEQTDIDGTAWISADDQVFCDTTIVLATPSAMQKARTSKTSEAVQSEKGGEEPQHNVQQVLLQEGAIQLHTASEVLATASSYFRRRLEDWDSDPWSMMGADGQLVLVVGMEEDELKVAESVVKLMYESAVPYSRPAMELAQICRVADMWGMQGCMQLCLTALTQLGDTQLLFEDLPAIARLLPESIQHLPNYEAWVDRCGRCLGSAAAAGDDDQPLLLHHLKDVHALLCSPQLLLQFRQLAFAGVRAWLQNRDLQVDSEDSIAAAVGWWASGEEGRSCSPSELKQLTQLLQVKYLVKPVRPLASSPAFPWLAAEPNELKKELKWMHIARKYSAYEGETSVPYEWKPWRARKQLPAEELQRRGLITWDVPRSDLEALLGDDKKCDKYCSPPQYLGGTAFQLVLACRATGQPDGSSEVGVSLVTCEYEQHGVLLAPGDKAMACRFEIKRLLPGLESVTVVGGKAWFPLPGSGSAQLFSVATATDFEPHLVDGCLKLSASVEVMVPPSLKKIRFC